ncbi:MAG: glucose 1-dehydrogenase [Pseudomonadota bacterium]
MSGPVGRLSGKVAIVTGAASGLGRATAHCFASEGASVLCADIDEQAAHDTVSLINDDGGRAIAMRYDAASPADNDAMARLALEHHKRIDILFANAGIPHAGTATTTTKEDWDRVLSVNLTGVWLANKAVIPIMLAQGGGSIINQSSITAMVGFSGVAAYAAAKGGVVALTRQAAIEYGAHNIRVNAICPGTIHTPLVTATYEQRGGISMDSQMSLDDALAASAERYPMKRLGTVEDVARMALFLASDESSWITGTAFPVDGGYTSS